LTQQDPSPCPSRSLSGREGGQVRGMGASQPHEPWGGCTSSSCPGRRPTAPLQVPRRAQAQVEWRHQGRRR